MKWLRLRAGLKNCMSPPARGAWIEMVVCAHAASATQSRPPHGGRGLKFQHDHRQLAHHWSPPARGAWIEMLTFRPQP